MRRLLIPGILFVLSFMWLMGMQLYQPQQGYAFSYINEGEYSHVRRGGNMATVLEPKLFYITYAISPDGSSSEGTKVYLDQKTTLTLIDASENPPKVALREGRIVTDGPIDIIVRNITVHSEFKASFVFYPWLDKLDVALLETGESYSLDTLHPETPRTETTFDPQNSSAAAFYTWALGGAIK